MSQNYFTQTPNFISASSGDVDPRTRLFGFNHSLTNLVGNYDMGPSLDLTLTYSPTTTDNSWGMGIGVMFTMTWYDKNTSTLYLNSGETYKILESADGSTPPSFEVQQCKIKTFNAEKIDDGTIWYRITDHDGNITELREVGAEYYRPYTLWSPLGRRLLLTWSVDGGNPFLSQVTDDNGTVLFSAVFDQNAGGPAMTLLPGSDSEQTVTLYIEGDNLASMENSALTDQGGSPVPWEFEYSTATSSSGLYPLNKITMPTGLVKSVEYDLEAMLFPVDPNGNAPTYKLPAVTKLTVSPGLGSPDIVTTWSFINESNKNPNYLGYNGTKGEDWSANDDYGYTLLDENYFYYSVSTQAAADDSGNPVTTTYQYNNYHLLLSTVTTQGGNVHTVDTTWYAEPGTAFDEQPASFQCPKLQTETWSDASGNPPYTRYTSYTYDNYGNLTQQVSLADSDGSVTTNSTLTEYKFYTPDGEEDSTDETTGCPKDPYGFVYRPKITKVTPPSVNGYGDVPVRTTRYRYKSMGTLNGMIYTTAVMPVQDTYYGSDVPTDTHTLMSRVNTYEANTGSDHYGRQINQTATTYDPNYVPEDSDSSDSSDSIESYTQTMDTIWSFTEDGSGLIQDDTLTTHDNLTVSASTTRLCLTGKPISITDMLGNISTLAYDKLGRLIEETWNSGTDYETSNQHDYVLDRTKDAVTAIQSIKTDSAGNQVQVQFDGMGRPIVQQHNANDAAKPDTWCQTATIAWDSWGRPLSSLRNDYTVPAGDGQTLHLTTQAQFDDWGQKILSIFSSGQQHYSVRDPVTQSEISQLQVCTGPLVLGSLKTLTDESKMTETEQILDKNGAIYATAVSEYDGLGRLRKTTDQLGYTTTRMYDPFDRISSSTLPDGAVQSWEYAAFSNAHLPVSVAIQKSESDTAVVMGTQVFDGLGRITASSCGGRSQSAVYSGTNKVPDSTTNAAGQTLNYTYIKTLDNALSQVTGNSLKQTFSYFSLLSDGPVNTGRLESAEETGSRSNTFTWLPSGIPAQEVMASSSGSYTSGNTWTLLGMPLTQLDVGGNTLALTYDDDGRLVKLVDTQVEVAFGYDDAGRLISQQVNQNGGGDSLTTTLTLDDYGRETQRDISPLSGEGLSIATTYYKNNQIQNRTTTQGGTVLRDETFTYDERNRMTDYACTGTAPPQDAYGQALSELHFTLDVYSNITLCQTILANGAGTDNAEYFYTNQDDPCQLSSVTHSLSNYPANINLAYDPNGRMTTDEAGRTLTYDEAGRLATISGTDGNSQYAYDAFDMLVTQSLSGDTRELYYAGNRLLSEVHVVPDQGPSQITRNIPGSWGTSAVSDETMS